ncbi:MAG: sensor histidine kinase [Aminipila sp.]
MKFFWKIFFCTIFITITCFSIGGYFLINSNFNSSLQREVNVAYEYGDIVYYSLINELKNFNQIKTSSLIVKKYNGDDLYYQRISEVAESMNINNMNEKISFCVTKENKDVLFSSLEENFDKNLIFNLSENQKGYMLKTRGDNTYIQIIRPAVLLNKICYIETLRNVSYIFNNQKMQYELLVRIVLIMLIVVGILTLFISKLLMKPIIRLTAATKQIANGNFSNRVEIKGEDEFAMLSKGFNLMSHELEEKIKQLKEEASKQELFVAAFSHELKTPLTSIIGYSDMLRSKQMDKERSILCANYIFEEGKRLETLSMRLLDLVVLRKQEIYYRKISTTDFFENISSVMFPILKELKISFVQKIEPAVIFIEPELIKTVFINLIDNARKAIRQNGEIVVYGKIDNNDYTVSICDNGKGMEENELEKITQAFYMVDKSRSRKEGGVGLGLAICNEILRLHGSEIHFSSQIDVGTCVTIKLKGDKDIEKISKCS